MKTLKLSALTLLLAVLLLSSLLYVDYLACDCGDVTFEQYAAVTVECLGGCFEPRTIAE